MKISVSQSFDAAHRLPGTGVHGHTYKVTAFYSGIVGDDGMVLSLQSFTSMLEDAVRRLDHSQLESTIGEPATAERVAEWIKSKMKLAVTVRVQVGNGGWVETE